jgi:Tfp pilus assembly protein FimT
MEVSRTGGTAAIQATRTDASTAGGIAIQAGSGQNNLNSAGAKPLVFYTDSTDRMRIDATGNVGIGTSSPSYNLDVRRTSTGNVVRFTGSTDGGRGLAFTSADNGIFLGAIWDYNILSGSGIHKWSIDSTERMRIDSSGTLFIGATSSPSGTQRLVLTANGSTGIEPMLFNELRSTSATENYVRFYRNGSQVGSISNTLSATAYNTSSDYRLKQNITPMTGALAKVAQLKPVTYKWKATGEDGQGFIAHELAEVVPDCVTGEKDAVKTIDELDEDGNVIGTKEVPKYQGIDTSFLVATLTAAIQELNAKVEAQAAEIAALKK